MTTPEYPRRSTTDGADAQAPFTTAGGPTTTDSAKDAGRQVAGTARTEAGHVASSAGEQVSNVASETAAQARNLLDETASEVRSQADDQMTRIGGTVRQLASEMHQMASHSDQQGPVAQFAGDVAARGSHLADWLEDHGPDDLVTSVRRYARRNPVGFLAAAAGAGLVVGRLARAMQAGSPGQGPGRGGRRAVTRAEGAAPTYAPEVAALGDSYPTSEVAGSPYTSGPIGTEPYGTAPTQGSLDAQGLGDETELPGEGMR